LNRHGATRQAPDASFSGNNSHQPSQFFFAEVPPKHVLVRFLGCPLSSARRGPVKLRFGGGGADVHVSPSFSCSNQRNTAEYGDDAALRRSSLLAAGGVVDNVDAQTRRPPDKVTGEQNTSDLVNHTHVHVRALVEESLRSVPIGASVGQHAECRSTASERRGSPLIQVCSDDGVVDCGDAFLHDDALLFLLPGAAPVLGTLPLHRGGAMPTSLPNALRMRSA
jgi:hypothetical protein